MEIDISVFFRLFPQNGFLTPAEFALCERLHFQIRSAQPPELLVCIEDDSGSFIHRDDQAIYLSKENGHNRITVV